MNSLKKKEFLTPLGPMIAVGDQKYLYLLQFVDHQRFDVGQRMQKTICIGESDVLYSIEEEIKAYMQGQLREFKTPCLPLGTPFQTEVWNTLKNIPWGHTRSYFDIAKTIGRKKAYRAVGNANGANPLVILIPCHRVIQKDHSKGGYSAGYHRKEWLLKHETL